MPNELPTLILNINFSNTYRRSGNFRRKKFSSVEFSRCFIFVDRPRGALLIEQKKVSRVSFLPFANGDENFQIYGRTVTKDLQRTLFKSNTCMPLVKLSLTQPGVQGPWTTVNIIYSVFQTFSK